MANRVSALASAYRPGRFGAHEATGVVIAERRGLSLVEVAAGAGAMAAVSAGIAAAVGTPPASGANSAIIGAGASILWIGPGQWLIVEAERPGRDLEAVLQQALAGTGAGVADVSQGRTVLRISGPHASDVLAKGTSIDLHPRAFAPGRCAQGMLGHVRGLLHAVDAAPTIDLYVARSLALTLWEWLVESAAEFGYRVDEAMR